MTASVADEKRAIPPPNKYNPHKDMYTEAIEKNPSRVYSKNQSILDTKPKPTPAPGGQLNDKTIDATRPRSASVVFNREKKEAYITKVTQKNKKQPAPNAYRVAEAFEKRASYPTFMCRKRM